jgi:hypothetical protein
MEFFPGGDPKASVLDVGDIRLRCVAGALPALNSIGMDALIFAIFRARRMDVQPPPHCYILVLLCQPRRP